MAETLTTQQRAAVENRGGSLLVSAAAGSGKTRVLVERLFRYVTEEGRNLDDFLIITYTKAAAAELRGKIAAELSARLGQSLGDRHLRRQLLRVYQADIKTVDAFCVALLRENTHLLAEGDGSRALTPDFRVLDENEAALLRQRVLREALEDFYADLSPGRELLADTLGAGRDDSALEALALDVYGKLQSHAWPGEWLEKNRRFWADIGNGAVPRFDDTPYAAEFLSSVRRKAEAVIRLLRARAGEMEDDPGLTKSYGVKFRFVAEALEPLSKAGTWSEARTSAALAASSLPNRLTAPRGRAGEPIVETLKTAWKNCRDNVKNLSKTLSADDEAAMGELRAMAPAMEALLDLTAQFSERYRTEKLRLNAADFSDQEHLALKLLTEADGSPTELGRQTAERYVEVLVDEYQDTNEVQNAIFRAVSREGRNLFTVGDVKQSIYRFRLADPGIFLRQYEAFTPWEAAQEGEPRKILLSRNFRSRREILDVANYVFGNLFSREMGEMDYGPDEALYFGAAYYPDRTDCATEFHLIADDEKDPDTVDGMEAVDGGDGDNGDGDNGDGDTDGASGNVNRQTAEARFVARRIGELLREGFPVTENGVLRPCQPGDIVILMRAPGTRGPVFAQALAEENIPCSFQQDEGFFESMEVSTALSLLEIVDNPRQDVPLISVLRSPVFGFTPDRLAEIRAGCRNGDFYDALLTDAGLPSAAEGLVSAEENEPAAEQQNDAETESPAAEVQNDAEAGEPAAERQDDAEAGEPAAERQDDAEAGEPAAEVRNDAEVGGTATERQDNAENGRPAAEDTRAFLATLEELRRIAPDMGVSEFLWHLYNSLNLLGLFGAMDRGEARKENLLSLNRHAERFERGGYKGLFAFITQMRRLLDAGKAPEGNQALPAAGVRLMTIHRSKGLEFPIVILADLNHGFSRQDFQTPVLFHPEMGLGPQCVDLERSIRFPTLARQAMERRLRRENLAEEMRILYVAMTRPKEKLILVDTLPHTVSKLKKLAALSSLPVDPQTVEDQKSFGDWLLLALLPRPEAEPLARLARMDRPGGYGEFLDAAEKHTTCAVKSFNDELPPPPYGGTPLQEGGLTSSQPCTPLLEGGGAKRRGEFAQTDVHRTERKHGVDTSGDTSADTKPLWGGIPWKVSVHRLSEFRDAPDAVRETERTETAGAFDPALLSWRYPWEREAGMPAKVTATQLKGRTLDEEIAENAAHTPYLRPLSQPKFRWKTGLTPAERGTAVHLALQYLDFADPDVKGQIARMRERDLLTAEQAAAVDVRPLERFLRSPLAADIRAGKRVRREYRFTLLLDASACDPAARSGDALLLQGVADCCFETAEGITVVDFKTDRIPTAAVLEERKQRYLSQMYTYSAALERVLERPVVRRVLYFLDAGEAVEV